MPDETRRTGVATAQLKCHRDVHTGGTLHVQERVGPFLVEHGFQIEDVANLDLATLATQVLVRRALED